VIPTEFDYFRPSSLAEALDLLDEQRDNAKLLAGGHSLIPLMKLRLAAPATLIDLRNVSEIRGISLTDNQLHIGAMTTHREVASSDLVAMHAPALAEAARQIGDRQVRARGTIGGSLAHNDPAADLPAVMLALDAEMVSRSKTGSRVVNAEDFLRGMLETALEPNEILAEVRIRPAPRSAYAKFPNPASHYAITGVAVAVHGDGAPDSVRIGITGAAPVAFRATAAESALSGGGFSTESIATAADAAYDGRELLGDIQASEEYRAALINVMTRRALQQIATW
jgi:aerobic carbon-monoxide dehydrogenase medium subunit